MGLINQITTILFKIWPTNCFSKAKSYNFYFHKNNVTWPLSANGLIYTLLIPKLHKHYLQFLLKWLLNPGEIEKLLLSKIMGKRGGEWWVQDKARWCKWWMWKWLSHVQPKHFKNKTKKSRFDQDSNLTISSEFIKPLWGHTCIIYFIASSHNHIIYLVARLHNFYIITFILPCLFWWSGSF